MQAQPGVVQLPSMTATVLCFLPQTLHIVFTGNVTTCTLAIIIMRHETARQTGVDKELIREGVVVQGTLDARMIMKA